VGQAAEASAHAEATLSAPGSPRVVLCGTRQSVPSLHANRTIASGYGKGFPVPMLKEAIDKIGF